MSSSDGAPPAKQARLSDTALSSLEAERPRSSSAVSTATLDDERTQTQSPFEEAAAAAAAAQAAAGKEELPLRYGTETWTGRKDTNEDRYIENEFFGDMGRYFGVFDGHAGTNCVEYVVRCLANNILGGFSYTPAAEDLEAQKNVRELAAQLQEPITNLAEVEKMLKDAPDNADLIGMRDMLQEMVSTLKGAIKKQSAPPLLYQSAVLKCMKNGFKCTDKNFLGSSKRKKEGGGSTAILGVINGTSKHDAHMIISNLGDCRAVLCRAGKAVRLSDDHKPSRPDEEKRIKGAGGRVVNVMGVHRATVAEDDRRGEPPMLLAVSRCFGDRQLKEPKPIVSFVPEVRIEPIQEEDAFLILACDGIWDVLSDQDAVDLAMEHWQKPKDGAAAIVRKAFKKGSEDNLTAMVIEFGWQDGLNFDAFLATAKELEAKKAEDYAAARAKADATADDNIF